MKGNEKHLRDFRYWAMVSAMEYAANMSEGDLMKAQLRNMTMTRPCEFFAAVKSPDRLGFNLVSQNPWEDVDFHESMYLAFFEAHQWRWEFTQYKGGAA